MLRGRFARYLDAVDSGAFRAFVLDRLAPSWAQSPELLKLLIHRVAAVNQLGADVVELLSVTA